MWRRNRDGRWLLLAFAVHALLLGSARLVLRDERRDDAALPTTPQELAVELESGEAPRESAPASRAASRAAVATGSPLAPTPQALPEVASAAAEPELAVLDNPVPEAVLEEPPGTASEAPAAAAEVDLGIGPDGWQRWAALGRETKPGAPVRTPRSGAYPTPKAPQRSNTGGLQEGLEARDRELGLGPSGRVISAFHRAAHASVAPSLGTASFHVTVTRTGEIQVSVGANSGETAKWRAVALRAAADLKKSLPRIPSGRNGVRLVIDIVAEESYPNGLNPKELYGPRIEATPPRLRSTEQAKAETEAGNPTATGQPEPNTTPAAPVQVDLPGVYLSQRGKVCGYRLGVTPLGPVLTGGCDPSNAGAKPQRMVRAKVRDEAMF